MKARMVSCLVVFLIFLGCIAHASAISRVDHFLAKMQTALQLTQTQADSIKPILQDNLSKHRELFLSLRKGTISKGSYEEQINQLKSDENQELSKILNQNQMQQWIKSQNQRMKHGSPINIPNAIKKKKTINKQVLAGSP